MIIKNKKLVTYTMVVLLFFSMVVVAKEAADYVVARKMADGSRLVVIDAGHGKTSGRPKEFELECSVLSSVSSSGSRI